MKLLCVVSSMNPSMGGIAQGIRNNLPYWLQSGLKVTILTMDAPDAQFVKQDNIVAVGGGSNAWGYSKPLKEWLNQHLSNYDVVVVHGLWLYNNYALYQVLKQLKHLGKPTPKLFVIPHGMLDPFFQKAKGRFLKAVRNVFYWHLIEKKLVKLADGILFTCEEEMLLAETTFYDYKPKNTYNIGFGINKPPQFAAKQKEAFAQRCPELADRKYILFLGRIAPKKGVDLLIDAYSGIKDKFWSESKHLPLLVIAGPSNDAIYKEAIVKKAKANALISNDIIFIDMLEGDSKWGALHGCEAFILPSHQENFGVAVVEAMACNKAVLLTNKVNIWREIEQANAGIVNTDDVTGTENSITKWLSLSEYEKQKMGLNAYQTYQTKFTAEHTTKQFISVLEGCMN